MKTVRLPLYEDGLELMEYLEIDVEHFLGAAGDALAHRYIRVVQMPTPEQEKEMIDRIIAGLPTRPFFEEHPLHSSSSAHYRLQEDGEVEQLVKPEQVEWRSNDWVSDALTGKSNPWRDRNENQPNPQPQDNWKTIPGLDSGNFQINELGEVRNSKTKRRLPKALDSHRGPHYRLVINRVPVFLLPDRLVEELF